MAEQLDLLGGSITIGPPAVPPVVYAGAVIRRDIRSEQRTERCAHCVLNAAAWRKDHRCIEQWRTPEDVVILPAAVVVTQEDGSTLFLCAQHDREHQQRGRRHG
jgi:hypothetical protein